MYPVPCGSPVCSRWCNCPWREVSYLLLPEYRCLNGSGPDLCYSCDLDFLHPLDFIKLHISCFWQRLGVLISDRWISFCVSLRDTGPIGGVFLALFEPASGQGWAAQKDSRLQAGLPFQPHHLKWASGITSCQHIRTSARSPNLGVLGSASAILLHSFKIYFTSSEFFSLFLTVNTHFKNLLVVALYSVLLIHVREEMREKPPSTLSARSPSPPFTCSPPGFNIDTDIFTKTLR